MSEALLRILAEQLLSSNLPQIPWGKQSKIRKHNLREEY
jgi:hypothetical protein